MASTLFSPGTVVASTWLNEVDIGSHPNLSAVAGTNTITANGPVSMLAYTRGQIFRFTPQNTNTGTVTININGLGAKAVTKYGATPLVAGDLLISMGHFIYYDGAQFQLINPRNTDLSTTTGTLSLVQGGTGITTIIPTGQCRLTKSGANLLLSRYNGDKLAFPAGYASIPAAGITLAPTALAVDTVFNIYAVQTAGAVSSLEASTTAHSQDTTTGIEIKTGDATRVLVGKARTITGPAWQDTAAQRFVISWYNRRPLSTSAAFTTTRTTASPTLTEVNTEIRNEFLVWGDAAITAVISGGVFNNTNGAQINSAIAVDSTTVALEGMTVTGNQAATNTIVFAMGATAITTPAEGYHFTTLLGNASAGTSSWTGSATVGNRTSHQVSLQG